MTFINKYVFSVNILSMDNESLLKNTALYKKFLAIRRDVELNKYYLSQKLGYDVGYEKALVDWALKYREKFEKNYEQTQQEQK